MIARLAARVLAGVGATLAVALILVAIGFVLSCMAIATVLAWRLI